MFDPLTRQGEARILIPYNQELRPGGFASAEIRAGSANSPLLPESAVQSDTRGSFVFIIDNNNTVVRRNVRIGEVSDHGVAIVEGLNGNERVVQSAGAFLNPGQKVRPKGARHAIGLNMVFRNISAWSIAPGSVARPVRGPAVRLAASQMQVQNDPD